MKIEQLQNGLADAIRQAAKRIALPVYRVMDIAPDTDMAMIRHYRDTGIIAVWAGASDSTIYGDRQINWLFRAWHDWCHIRSGVCNAPPVGPLGCFEPIAEYAVADWQCIGLGDELARLVQCEVSAQAKYFADTGRFVTDQVAFTLERLP